MCWTQYSSGGGSISAQSSQEECPEAMIEIAGAELARSHALVKLEKTVETRIPKPAYRYVYTSFKYLYLHKLLTNLIQLKGHNLPMQPQFLR